MTARSRLVSRHRLAVLAARLAALLHVALAPVWGGRISFVAFYPAVVFVAWFAGMGPGLLATVVSALLITRAWLVAPTVSAEGHVVALAFFVGAGVTVSLLVAARDRARDSVDLLLRHTPLGLAIHDADFRYVRVNRALAEMNGLAPGAHRGRTVREVLGDAAADLLEPLLQRVHTTRRPVTVDSLRVPLSDDPSETGERYFSLIYSPILDGRGRVTGTTASVVEVTARVRAEQALDHERELLQTIIDTIPAMITMFTPDTRVLRLNREFERVTGWTAAEAQRVDFMAACYPDAEYRAMVRRHMEAPEPGWLDLEMTTKSGGVVQTSWSNVRLSDGSRVGIGVDITERKAHEAELVAARATAGTERHRISVDGRPVWVTGDATRLEQVVTNLVSNALKFTPAGGTIRVWTGVEGGEALLRVSDSGVGMSPDLLPRIFDLFVQGDQPPERASGGLGIGLTLVRQLVELHGGRVEARSAGAGQGSVFTIRLPVARTTVSDDAGGRQAGVAPCRILVVEDNADARDMLLALLTLDRHEVVTAADGPAGVDAALRLRPNVALVDIGLPGLNGYEVARRIRATESGRTIKLIALTGYGQSEDMRQAREAGFDLHLVKPVEPGRLDEALRALRPTDAQP